MKTKKSDLNPPDTDFMKNSKTASMNECTGLIQNIPENKFEKENYEDLYQTQTDVTEDE